jgi:hypothetical protein
MTHNTWQLAIKHTHKKEKKEKKEEESKDTVPCFENNNASENKENNLKNPITQTL